MWSGSISDGFAGMIAKSNTLEVAVPSGPLLLDLLMALASSQCLVDWVNVPIVAGSCGQVLFPKLVH